MYIYNFKINGSKIFKFTIIFIVLIAILVLSISIHNFYFKSKFSLKDTIPSPQTININSSQYTNILKQVYDNVDDYINQSVSFTGYVYKLTDFNDTEFVLARDMLINSDSQSVIVGFLCSYENAKTLKEGTWVNVTGKIIKGYYHNEIPVIDINSIQETEKPEEEYVYPPDNTYIPTSNIF